MIAATREALATGVPGARRRPMRMTDERKVVASIALRALASRRSAQAETYPSRPITLIVPAAPGGGNDTVARVIAEKMSRLLGQQLVVENRAGAGGTIAARQVARSGAGRLHDRHRQSGDARDGAVDPAECRLRPGEGLSPRSA